MTNREVIIKSLLYTLFAFVFLVIISAIVGLGYVYRHWRLFASSANVNRSEIETIIRDGLEKEPTQTANKKNILILGLDSLETRGGSPPLTDTILIAQLDYEAQQMHLYSLPRDLWSTDYQTKINALYTYGLDRNSENPTTFPEQVISEMTGLEIHHTVPLTLDTVAELIDTLGGVTVDVPAGFIDKEFPRPEVDVTQVADPELLYEVVVFEAGVQDLNAERALQYIRSRKSADERAGTDISRGNRQQLVISALVSELMSPETFTNPELQARLFTLYQSNFDQYLPLWEVIASAKILFPERGNITLIRHQLPIYPENENGVIEHPDPALYDGLWIYTIRDEQNFRQFFNYAQR